MSTPCQLATMIEMVAPRLHPALVCRDNVDSILAISRVLPSWQCAGFECRLGDPAPRADFGVHLRRTHGIPIDEELLGQGGPLDADSGDAWHRLRSFARAWSGTEGIDSAFGSRGVIGVRRSQSQSSTPRRAVNLFLDSFRVFGAGPRERRSGQ